MYNIGIRETRYYRSSPLLSDFAIEQNLEFITKGLSGRGPAVFR